MLVRLSGDIVAGYWIIYCKRYQITRYYVPLIPSGRPARSRAMIMFHISARAHPSAPGATPHWASFSACNLNRHLWGLHRCLGTMEVRGDFYCCYSVPYPRPPSSSIPSKSIFTFFPCVQTCQHWMQASRFTSIYLCLLGVTIRLPTVSARMNLEYVLLTDCIIVLSPVCCDTIWSNENDDDDDDDEVRVHHPANELVSLPDLTSSKEMNLLTTNISKWTQNKWKSRIPTKSHHVKFRRSISNGVRLHRRYVGMRTYTTSGRKLRLYTTKRFTYRQWYICRSAFTIALGEALMSRALLFLGPPHVWPHGMTTT